MTLKNLGRFVWLILPAPLVCVAVAGALVALVAAHASIIAFVMAVLYLLSGMDLDGKKRRHMERTGYPQIDAWLNANFKDPELPERKVTTQWAKQQYAWLDETEPNAVTCLVSYFRDTLDSESLDSRLDANLKLGEYAGQSKPHLVCEPVVEERAPHIRQDDHGQYHISTWDAHLIGLPPDGTRQHFATAVDHSGRHWQLFGAAWISRADHSRRADRPFLPNGKIRRGRS